MGDNFLLRNRNLLEGNFVLSLYSNPLELYGDFAIDPDKDLLTPDGKFYYNLGNSMVRKGIKKFDEISITTFLNEYPELKKEYESKGGWKAIADATTVLDPANIEAYYQALVKNNLLIRLDKRGFDVEDKVDLLNKLNTADEIIDYYEGVLNTIALNITHDLRLQTLNLTEKDISKKQSGEQLGLQFKSASPILNSLCGGIPRKGLTMFASYTNGGKTSFVFENIVIPIISQGIKACIISNEQDAIVFKDLLYLHVLTSDLDYWAIDRTKLRSFRFNKEEMEMWKKADKIVKEKYMPFVVFQRVYDYGMKNVKRTIKKLSRQGYKLFVYDTFKVDSTTESIWQSFLNDSKELFQIASKEEVAVITPVQIALSTKGKVRWLNESVLSNSKQISEIYEEIFTFRDVWQDEYSGRPQDIRPYRFENEEKEDGTFNREKKQIELVFDENSHYKIFFHTKSRNGEVGKTILYEFKPYANKWKEMGYCLVGEENRM